MLMPNSLPEREEANVPREEGHVAPLDSSSAEVKPFVLPNRTGGKGGKDKTAKMLLIVIGAVILFVTFFGFISTKGSHKKKSRADEAAKPNLGRVVTPSAPGALIPSDKMAVPPAAAKNGTLDASDIEKTKAPVTGSAAATAGAAQKGSVSGNKTLGDLAQFQPPNTDAEHLKDWKPEPYSGTNQGNNASQSQEIQKEQDEFSKPSVIFVAHETTGSQRGGIQMQPEPGNFGLESGYHVAARLEAMASTALHAPVTAVIEYNYERNGKILIPAGARAVGKISQADATGILDIQFSSIELQDGQSVSISAIGATTSLQALKGQVTGKNAGRSFAIRSLAGLGQAGAMLIGQGNINSAISESDMIRERAAENIGNSADAQVMNLMTTQHIVVSVPAGTEIYLIFTKPQKINPTAAQTVSVATNTQ
jgi:Bacterial conjugation TrbI-like protein